MLIINDLTKYYGRLCALDHISMHIHDGDLYGFVGPNGCRKNNDLKNPRRSYTAGQRHE